MQYENRSFEVDPLECPKCGDEMKIISFVTPAQPAVLQKILDHLGEDTERPCATGPPKWLQIIQAQEHMAQHPEWYPEDETWDQVDGHHDWASY